MSTERSALSNLALNSFFIFFCTAVTANQLIRHINLHSAFNQQKNDRDYLSSRLLKKVILIKLQVAGMMLKATILLFFHLGRNASFKIMSAAGLQSSASSKNKERLLLATEWLFLNQLIRLMAPSYSANSMQQYNHSSL